MEMSEEERKPLNVLAETLGARDWRAAAAAERTLLAAGDAGVAAVLAGLRHADPRVRRGGADFMDHHGTDRCVTPLTATALTDPIPRVRRAAVHSLACQRCKASPLAPDVIPLLIDRLENDPNPKVRREAAYGLGTQPRDPRAADALRRLLESGNGDDTALRRLAHGALKRQDPAYRDLVSRQARERAATAPVAP